MYLQFSIEEIFVKGVKQIVENRESEERKEDLEPFVLYHGWISGVIHPVRGGLVLEGRLERPYRFQAPTFGMPYVPTASLYTFQLDVSANFPERKNVCFPSLWIPFFPNDRINISNDRICFCFQTASTSLSQLFLTEEDEWFFSRSSVRHFWRSISTRGAPFSAPVDF